MPQLTLRLCSLIFTLAIFCTPLALWAEDEPSASAEPDQAAPSDVAPEVVKAEDVPPARSTLLTNTRNEDYYIPLSFDPSESGILFPPVEIEYDLTQDDGQTLKIGPVVLNSKTFAVTFRLLSELSPELKNSLAPGEDRQTLIFRWPESLVPSGELEAISRSGRILWKKSLKEEDLAQWKKKLEDWKASLRGQNVSESVLRRGLFVSQWGAQNIGLDRAPSWADNEIFRFCFSRSEGKQRNRLCSPRLTLYRQAKSIQLRIVPWKVTPKVLINNKPALLKDSVPFKDADGMAQFYAEISTGQSYEFLSELPDLHFVDLADTKKRGVLRVTGYGQRPLNYNLILNPDNYSKLTKMFGFEPTIGDQRKFWTAGILESDPRLYFQGDVGGIFLQKLQLTAVPMRAGRVNLSWKTLKGTYASHVHLKGRKQPNSKVSSEENSVEEDSSDPTLFDWDFRSANKGEINRSYLDVSYLGKNYKSYYEIYRSYPYEFSTRLSGIAAAGSAIFVGELSFNWWFENWFGWDNYLLTRERWGISAKLFKSFTQLPVGNGTGANLDSYTLDLKYRFTPGLWTFDETFGAILAYQKVTFQAINAPMLGAGGFWARSMPRILDDFLNHFPLMNYPKWVDMEYIYFFNSMSPDVTITNTMALNFHGQVLWKSNFFGEAGFGYKRYGMTAPLLNQQAKIDTFYGTVGLGLKF